MNNKLEIAAATLDMSESMDLSTPQRYKRSRENSLGGRIIISDGEKVDKTVSLYQFSGTYCHKTGTRPPSCSTPRQPTIYSLI